MAKNNEGVRTVVRVVFRSKRVVRFVVVTFCCSVALAAAFLLAKAVDSMRVLPVNTANINDYTELADGQGLKVMHQCHQKEPLEILFFVHSATEHLEHRAFFRRTLGANSTFAQRYRTSIVFFLGQAENSTNQEEVDAEAEEFGDMVIFPFSDTYRNLTLKFLYGIRWIERFCLTRRSPNFLVKLDDDAFVNAWAIREYIRHNITIDPEHSMRSIHCLVWRRTRVVRHRNSKWFVSKQEYNSAWYPTYCGGLGYIVPAGILPRLYAAAERASFLWVDDVYSTGILMREAHLGHIQLHAQIVVEPNATDLAQQNPPDPGIFFWHMNTPQLRALRPLMWQRLEQFYESNKIPKKNSPPTKNNRSLITSE